jgi:hypothetical protein
MSRDNPPGLPVLSEPAETRAPDRRGTEAALALAQGLYYASTGAWALADSRSFQAVTGPKVDVWLVKTVGVLVAAIGGALGCAGWHRRITPEIRRLAVGSALGLAGIDVVYVAKGRISRVYLLDAVVELGLAAAWATPKSQARIPDDPTTPGVDPIHAKGGFP